MNQENIHFKKEVKRLNGLIDVLLIQNRILLNEICRLTNGMAPSETISLLADFEIGGKHADSAYSTLAIGGKHTDSSVATLTNGGKHADSSVATLTNGGKHTDSSVATFTNGRKHTDSSLPGLHNGGNLPEVVPPIEVTRFAVNSLSYELRRIKSLKRIKHGGVRNMALIILQAHNGQTCSHRDLRKLTGLSEGGIAKLMISMKKRGLIHRTGFKRFGVSENVKQMLGRTLENKQPFTFRKAA